MPVTDKNGRDRDPAGRPRNARPRDHLGRPLGREGGQDEAAGIPDDLRVSPGEAAELGGGLLRDGRPFHAHEVFEAAWKSAAGPERDLWQGLAQVAVGLTHARRGNARGAAAVLRRGAARLGGYAAATNQEATNQEATNQEATNQEATSQEATSQGASAYGIDVAFVGAQVEALADRIENDGLAAVPEAALLLPLRP